MLRRGPDLGARTDRPGDRRQWLAAAETIRLALAELVLAGSADLLPTAGPPATTMET
ncbi:MAG: hypothetical protein ACJ74U_10590 [Jatrophihabitantaceae bacterium]